MEAGYTVVNPARVNAQLPEETTHAEYMMTSIVMLDMCDGIYMMKGWEKSEGCKQEIYHAMKHGHVIIFEKDETNEEKQAGEGKRVFQERARSNILQRFGKVYLL